MNEQKIASTLYSINSWWSGLGVPPRIKKSDSKRKVFYDLVNNCLKDDKICSITGPRQVGKTTLMGQMMQHQIDNGIDPKRIIYIPIDNELLNLNSDNILIDCLDVYLEHVLGEAPQALESEVYVYLDEIQSLDGWAKQIKSYYDTHKNIKFILSGSSHTKLYNDASESLVGRIQFRLVLPFKFREFLDFNLVDESNPLKFSTVKLRDSLKKSIEDGTPDYFYKEIFKLQTQLSLELPKIKKLLDVYLIKGGYPGLLEFKEDYDKASERLRTDLELTVYKDIHKIFKTRNSSDLMSLLVLIASSSGQKINHSRLSSAIGIDRRVIADYLYYTDLLCLTSHSPFHQSSKYRQAEKQNKAYLLDVGHRNALLGRMDNSLLASDEMGLVIQTAVFNHASRLRFYLSNYSNYEINYWEDGSHEVDLVMDLPLFVLPMEVKSKSAEKGKASVFKFMEEHKKSKWGMIISKDELKMEKNILFMPLWAFLIMC